MTAAPAPTLLTLYALTPRGRIKAAHFHWSPEAGVSLEVLDPGWSSYANALYADGVRLNDGRRVVSREDGEPFMRALLQPARTTYYHIVDESTGGPDTPTSP